MFKKFLTSTLLILVAVGGFFGVSINKTEINQNGIISFHHTLNISETYARCADGGMGPCPPDVSEVAQNKATKEMLDKLVAAINIILNILTIIVTPAIMLATWLMSPDWTAGDIFGLRPVLHELWITVSNITYFIYAILLIFIALATIFNSEHYGYKAMLPKLALGIIMVPLTWWAVQFTVSLASYVTASAISIPAETIAKYTDKNTGSWWTTASIPKEITYQNDKFTDSSVCASVPCLSPKDVVTNAGGMFSPLLIYSFAVFKIQDIKNIQTTTDVVTTIFSLIHQGIIGILMFVVYGLLVLALIFMLMMRALKLWFYAIFSPLFTIKYVLGDKAFGDADKDGSMNITEFIGLAFVPAVVCIALSFGLVIISAMMSPLGSANNTDNSCVGTKCTIVIMGIPDNTIVNNVIEKDGKKISQTIVKIGGVSYTWEGSVSGSTPAVGGLKSALGATGNLFGTIIIDIIALVFIWIAFMAGKGVSKAASAAIAPFESMGKKIGELGMSLPKYASIPGTGGLSMKSMERVPDSITSAISKNDNEKFERSSLGKMLHADINMPPDMAKKLNEALKKGGPDSEKTIREILKLYGNRNMAYNSGTPEAFMENMKDKTKRDKYLDDLHVTDLNIRDAIKRFADDSTKNGLHTDHEKQEFMQLLNSALGNTATAGKTSNNTLVGAKVDLGKDGTNTKHNIRVGEQVIEFALDSTGDKVVKINDADIKKFTKGSIGMPRDKFMNLLRSEGKLSEAAAKEISSKFGEDVFTAEK